jgi:hypothetical protein
VQQEIAHAAYAQLAQVLRRLGPDAAELRHRLVQRRIVIGEDHRLGLPRPSSDLCQHISVVHRLYRRDHRRDPRAPLVRAAGRVVAELRRDGGDLVGGQAAARLDQPIRQEGAQAADDRPVGVALAAFEIEDAAELGERGRHGGQHSRRGAACQLCSACTDDPNESSHASASACEHAWTKPM